MCSLKNDIYLNHNFMLYTCYNPFIEWHFGGDIRVLWTLFLVLICQSVWKTVKYQGKIGGKSGNFEVNDKLKPWLAKSTILICEYMIVSTLFPL